MNFRTRLRWALVALVAGLGAFTASALSESQSLFRWLSPAVGAQNRVILGSGVVTEDRRDLQNIMISCEGPACPEGDLPQPAYLVDRHYSYADPLPGTQYIAQVPDATTLQSPGYTCCSSATFENVFRLPPEAASASIGLSAFGDNAVTVSINGVEFGGHGNLWEPENYAGPAETFCTEFTPDPSGNNRLQVTLNDGGGALGLDYQAKVTYDSGEGRARPADSPQPAPAGTDGSSETSVACDPVLSPELFRDPAGTTFDHLKAAAGSAVGIPGQLIRLVRDFVGDLF